MGKIVIIQSLILNHPPALECMVTERIKLASTEEIDYITAINDLLASPLAVKEVKIINTGPITLTDETGRSVVFSGTLVIDDAPGVSRINVLYAATEDDNE
jgi:hypothetical protein